MARTVGFPAAVAAQFMMEVRVSFSPPQPCASHKQTNKQTNKTLFFSHFLCVCGYARVLLWFCVQGIITRKGVLDPTPRDVYVPILRELKKYQIECVEASAKIEL